MSLYKAVKIIINYRYLKKFKREIVNQFPVKNPSSIDTFSPSNLGWNVTTI
jgi:hypothetical protein